MCDRIGKHHLLVGCLSCLSSLPPVSPPCRMNDHWLWHRGLGSNKGLCTKRTFNVIKETPVKTSLQYSGEKVTRRRHSTATIQNWFLLRGDNHYHYYLCWCAPHRKLLKHLYLILVLGSKADFYHPTVVGWIGNLSPLHTNTQAHVFEHSFSNWCHCFGRLRRWCLSRRSGF